MNQIKTIIRDVLYVSKVTKVNNKKILVLTVALLAQLTAVADIAIISIFAAIIADQFTNVDFVNKLILSTFFSKKMQKNQQKGVLFTDTKIVENIT